MSGNRLNSCVLGYPSFNENYNPILKTEFRNTSVICYIHSTSMKGQNCWKILTFNAHSVYIFVNYLHLYGSLLKHTSVNNISLFLSSIMFFVFKCCYRSVRNWDSSVITETRLLTGWPRNRGLIPNRGKRFFFFP
jgi:hypothetical protein